VIIISNFGPLRNASSEMSLPTQFSLTRSPPTHKTMSPDVLLVLRAYNTLQRCFTCSLSTADDRKHRYYFISNTSLITPLSCQFHGPLPLLRVLLNAG